MYVPSGCMTLHVHVLSVYFSPVCMSCHVHVSSVYMSLHLYVPSYCSFMYIFPLCVYPRRVYVSPYVCPLHVVVPPCVCPLRVEVPPCACSFRVCPSVGMSPSYLPLRIYVPSVCSVPSYDCSFTCVFPPCVCPSVCMSLRVCPLVYVPDGICIYVPHRIVGGVDRFM